METGRPCPIRLVMSRDGGTSRAKDTIETHEAPDTKAHRIRLNVAAIAVVCVGALAVLAGSAG